MANTPIYGWETPDDTDYVYQGAAASRTTANAIDTTVYSLPQGVKSYLTDTTANLDTATTTEFGFMASGSFTPVAGRLYAITISIGAIQKNTSNGLVNIKFRKDNTSGTLLTQYSMDLLGNSSGVLSSPFYYSNTTLLTSTQMGTTAFNPHVSIQSTGNGFMANNSSQRPGSIIVTDIGPA